MSKIQIDKWIKVMDYINKHNGCNLSKIAKHDGTSFGYVHKMVNKLKENNFVETKKKGRVLVITMTETGTELGRLASGILDLLRSQRKKYAKM